MKKPLSRDKFKDQLRDLIGRVSERDRSQLIMGWAGYYILTRDEYAKIIDNGTWAAKELNALQKANGKRILARRTYPRNRLIWQLGKTKTSGQIHAATRKDHPDLTLANIKKILQRDPYRKGTK